MGRAAGYPSETPTKCPSISILSLRLACLSSVRFAVLSRVIVRWLAALLDPNLLCLVHHDVHELIEALSVTVLINIASQLEVACLLADGSDAAALSCSHRLLPSKYCCRTYNDLAFQAEFEVIVEPYADLCGEESGYSQPSSSLLPCSLRRLVMLEHAIVLCLSKAPHEPSSTMYRLTF